MKGRCIPGWLLSLSVVPALVSATGFAQCALTTWASNGTIGFTQGTTAPTNWKVVDTTNGAVVASTGQVPAMNVTLKPKTGSEKIDSPSAPTTALLTDSSGNVVNGLQRAITGDMGLTSGGPAFVGRTSEPANATAVELGPPKYALVNYRAYNVVVVCGTLSQSMNITPPGRPIPPPSLSLASTNPLTISWTAPDPSQVVDRGYTVEYSTVSTGPWTGLASGIASMSYTVPAGRLGGKFFLAVASGNGLGIGALSARLPVTLPPTTPAGLQSTNAQSTAASTAYGAVDLSWAPSMGATSYNVGMSSSSAGPFASRGTVTTTTLNVQGLTMGATYYFVVTASGPTGSSATSAPAIVRVGKFLM